VAQRAGLQALGVGGCSSGVVSQRKLGWQRNAPSQNPRSRLAAKRPMRSLRMAKLSSERKLEQ